MREQPPITANFELFPLSSSERMAVVLSMADGIAANNETAFPLEYEADSEFDRLAQERWRKTTGVDGKEIMTTLYYDPRNVSLDLGLSYISGSTREVSLASGSAVDQLLRQTQFKSNGRIVAVVHTHPSIDRKDAQAGRLYRLIDHAFGVLDQPKGIRFSKGDHIFFESNNVLRLKGDATHTVASMVIEEDGVGLMVGTKDFFDRLERYKEGQMSTKSGKRVNLEDLENALNHQYDRNEGAYVHRNMDYAQAREHGIIVYHHVFGEKKWHKVN